MCFSATASFGLGSALIISRLIQHRVSPIKFTDTQFVLSLFPLVFGIQQIIEGIVWLSTDYHIWLKWKEPALYSFVLIAQVIWPIAVPFSFLRMENNIYRKRILKGLTILGSLTATYLLFCISFFPIDVTERLNHLIYELRFGNNPFLNSGIFYFIPTVLPAFFSSRPKAIVFAFLVLISFTLSKSLFPNAFISIWCYFAAAISISIYWLLKKEKTKIT